MSDREVRDFLLDTLKREKDYYDFCIECLTKLYGDQAKRAINIFNESIDFFEYNGCLQSLCCIDSQLKKELKNVEEMKAIRENEAKTKEVS